MPSPLLQAHRLVRRHPSDRALHRIRALRRRVHRCSATDRRYPALLQDGGRRVRDRARDRPVRSGPVLPGEVELQLPAQLRLRHAGHHQLHQAADAHGHLRGHLRRHHLPGPGHLRPGQEAHRLERLSSGRGLAHRGPVLPGLHSAVLHRNPGRVHSQHQRARRQQASRGHR